MEWIEEELYFAMGLWISFRHTDTRWQKLENGVWLDITKEEYELAVRISN